MQSACSRRAGAGVVAWLSSSTCRAIEPQVCGRRVIATTAAPAYRTTSHLPHCRLLSTAPSRRQTAPNVAASPTSTPNTETPDKPNRRSLTDGLSDPLPLPAEDESQVDWTRSFHGLSSTPFTEEQAAILQAPIEPDDIEVKPDGIIYLPEIKYRRILNRAFGPGGWGLAPRGETIVTAKLVTREYGLVCHGRLVSIARGEQQYFDPDGIPTATEGCKSNALMRCCKDLGIASELWDPRYIRRFMAASARELLVEHQATKKRRKHFMRRDDELKYPWKEIPIPGSPATSTGVKAPAAAGPASSGSGTGSKAPSSSGTAAGYKAPATGYKR